jgi:hypothetical protein
MYMPLIIMEVTGESIPGWLNEQQYSAVEYISGIHRDTNCHVSPYSIK